MENELLKSAYAELAALSEEKPNWQVYTRMGALWGAVSYLEKFSAKTSNTSTIDEAIEDMVYIIGEKATIETLKRILNSLKSDLDTISPNVSAQLIKRLKERL